METIIIVDISPPFHQILVLELWAKMLSANQIAGFFKM